MITNQILIEVIHHRLVTPGKGYSFGGCFEEKIRPPSLKPAVIIYR